MSSRATGDDHSFALKHQKERRGGRAHEDDESMAEEEPMSEKGALEQERESLSDRASNERGGDREEEGGQGRRAT